MTKVQTQFKLGKLDPDAYVRLRELSTIYGILQVTLHPQATELTIEYDATRLEEKDVEAALARAGIPVEQ